MAGEEKCNGDSTLYSSLRGIVYIITFFVDERRMALPVPLALVELRHRAHVFPLIQISNS